METEVKIDAAVTRYGGLDMQVCVPFFWDDEQVVAFAEHHYPSGTKMGWRIRRDPLLLNGDAERITCATLEMNVHITLDV